MHENCLTPEIVNELKKFEIIISPSNNTDEELLKALSERINELIAHNFSFLISLLYRIDISEKKLKERLDQSDSISSGDIIAGMIIERQSEKIRTRKLFAANDNSNEERW